MQIQSVLLWCSRVDDIVSYHIDVEDAGCEASKPSSLWNTSVQQISNQFWHTLLFPVPVISHLKFIDLLVTVLQVLFGPFRTLSKVIVKRRRMVFCVTDSSVFVLHTVSKERTAKCHILSAPCYASRQSDHSSIITPSSPFMADTHKMTRDSSNNCRMPQDTFS